MFGQWTFSENVTGLTPAQRKEDAKHKVRAFNRLIKSVWGYSVNLNTHPAYTTFRQRRVEYRRHGKVPRGTDLAGMLIAYSEKGPGYVALISSIIATNRLDALDGARLESTLFAGS